MRRYLASFVILLLFLAACGGGKKAPEVLEATFAKGLSEQMEPIDPTDEFEPEDTVYLSVKLKGNPQKGVVTVRYFYGEQEITAVDLDLEKERKEKGTLFVLGGNTFLGYTLSPTRPFPAGDTYRAEVLVNGELVGAYRFKVVGPTPIAVAPTPEESGPPEILEVTFAKGLSDQMEPVDPGDEYLPDETVYLSVKLKGIPKQGQVGARFFYGEQEITSTSLDLVTWHQQHGEAIQGNMYVGFTLSHEKPFPVSDDYRAELSINGSSAGSYTFKVVAPPAAPTATPQPSAGKGSAVASLADVKSAVIQIEAQGSFVHPQFGEVLNSAGRGSGFIIDPSGIAVTNNHVAAGSAFLKVWVGGESEPRNAKVLGVSECSDLAVIDIEGEGYPYLEWYDGDVRVGLEIYAAGFPLGDPEYTLLQGIVSKERASGETNWASVDKVIEHTALTNPGNSGGPVVTKDGKVVAVHYAGRSDTIQHFAIARAEALPVIEKLRQGIDVNSIGVNGQAVNNGQGISGIWVSSVESGSPADRAGIQAGDIIIKLEGLVLATDGTMADYCDVLRSHEPTDVLSVEVLRFATQEVLAGQLNGRELTQKISLAPTAESGGGGGGGQPTVYSGYRTVQDDTGALTVDIPVEWKQVNGSPWTIDGQVIGAAIAAAADLDAFINTWSEPGIFLGASQLLAQKMSEVEVLDNYDFSDDCQSKQRFDNYDDGLYTGQYDIYSGCGDVGSDFVILAAVPEDRAYLIVLQVGAISQADSEALDKIADSFRVIGELPSQ